MEWWEGEQGLRVQIDGLSGRKAVETPMKQDFDGGDLVNVSWKNYGITIMTPVQEKNTWLETSTLQVRYNIDAGDLTYGFGTAVVMDQEPFRRPEQTRVRYGPDGTNAFGR